MRSLREITSLAELRRGCADDGLVMWAAQGLVPGVRAWRRGDAVAVASPYLSCRDRLAVYGPAADGSGLVAEALAVVGPTYRLIGPADLVGEVAGRITGLEVTRTFGWMETDRPAAASTAPPEPTAPPARTPEGTYAADGARWLDPHWSSPVAELLAEAYPESYARPGLVGVRRWAGAITPDGALAAVTADAWSAPDVGYVAGVATREPLRGRGYAAAAFRLAVDTLVAERGRVALMVNAANRPAVALYRRCGLTWRTLAAAGVAMSRVA
ncbi:MAG TPA: GNAT family N-acetyltransferase [Actinopolymorphaceae bacterium]|nr:GNAT family N-acetyltransferase [Actinopolymorphaceae bacterium]